MSARRTFAALGFCVSAALAPISGCTQPQRIFDAGVSSEDAPPSPLDAPTDAGSPPSDVPGADAPPPDTGSAVDTGPRDAGPPDAGPPDAGPMGACTNAADRAALPMSFSGMTVEEHARACASPCLSEMAGAVRQACLNDCIQGPTRVDGAISSECTNCVALLFECRIANCISFCATNPTGAMCLSCQCTSGCVAMADACSGIPSGLCP